MEKLPLVEKIDPQLLADYHEALRRYRNRKDLLGIDIGFRYEKNNPTDELAIRFLVPEKPPLQSIPGGLFPKTIHKSKTDIVQCVSENDPHSFWIKMKKLFSAASMPQSLQPIVIQPGMSIRGKTESGYVTLGMLVQKFGEEKPMGLTAYHLFDKHFESDFKVLCNESLKEIGFLDDLICESAGEAALIRLNESYGRDIRPGLLVDETITFDSSRAARLGEEVSLYGAGSKKINHGQVDGIGCRFVGYFNQFERTVIEGFRVIPLLKDLEKQPHIARGHDSGAIWYTKNDNGYVGLGINLAGESRTSSFEHAFACHLPSVLDRLGVKPWTGNGGGKVKSIPDELIYGKTLTGQNAMEPHARELLEQAEDANRRALELVGKTQALLNGKEQ